jgi:hypothetical protein
MATELVKRVDKLTPEQSARMPEWAAKWIGIGLRTGPADRQAFERHVAQCYVATGLTPPKRVVWTTSPFVLAVAAPAAALAIEWRKRAAESPAFAAALQAWVRRDRDSVRDSVDDSVGASVDASVGASVRDSVRDSVDASVDASVGASVFDKAITQVIQACWHKYIGGQFWVGWGWSYWGSPSFVSFFRDVCGLTLGDEMDARAVAYAGTAESACWWWPHRDFVMVCERPVRIERDSQGRLHSLTGKAIEWPDGWGLYRIHGVTVPPYVVEHPELITVERIDEEANDEVRRIMVDRYGSERFLRDSGARKVQQDEYGTLYERRFQSGQPAVFIHLVNSTREPDGSRREFWRRVHPEFRPLLGDGQLGEPQKMTARNAVASTYGMRGEDYSPCMQT